MTKHENKNNTINKTQQSTNVKKSLPSGTVTTTRSSMFELSSKDGTKKN